VSHGGKDLAFTIIYIDICRSTWDTFGHRSCIIFRVEFRFGMPLKPDQVTAAITSGVDQKIADGHNLYLVVRNRRGFWVLQYRDGPKIRSKGLGSASKLSPAQARRAREEFVVRLRADKRRSREGEGPRARNGSENTPMLFGEAVEKFIIHRAGVKNWKGGVSGAEADSYRRTLIRTNIAKVPLASITTANVLAMLTLMPAVTAEKTRTRVSCVLDWAKAMGYRESAENVARRRGHMEYLLGTVPKAKHHAALPWAEVPALMRELQSLDSPASRALQWTILTAARASETLGAMRSEIKSPTEFAQLAKLPLRLVEGETWVVPAERMKEGKEHYVPLSEQELALVRGRKGKLFPGHERQMLDLIYALRPGYTVHGFRSSFADWAAEHDYPQELREMALAHSVGDSVEQAYRHSTRLNKRREMMIAWSRFAVTGRD
jgi:integrase